MNYNAALRFLDTLPAEGANLKANAMRLERMHLLLKLLGNPHRRYQAIHVAGTAGKGSTCAIAAQLLTAHGVLTGLHSSPHLQTIRERMSVDGKKISESEFAALATKIEPLCKRVAKQLPKFGIPTYYEATLAMAFQHFADNGVKIAVVETGLGGALDATNVLKPKVAVITNVGLDHTEILGHTIALIAKDKAGIIKRGAIVVTGANGSALKIIEKKALKNHAPILRLGNEILIDSVLCDANGSTFCLHLLGKHFHNLRLSLVGPYQAVNAGLAIAACSKIIKLDEKKVRKPLATAFVPCRLEIMQRKPLVILDGAHNPMKARALAATLPLFGHKFVFVVGISATKDAAGIIRALKPLAAEFIFTRGSDGKRFYPPQELKAIAGMGKVEPNLRKAVPLALSIALRRKVPACVTGSLYVAGEARGFWAKAAARSRGKGLKPHYL
jgi:dihydrofolate synthase/folylpolyglutamate synthase